MKVRRVRVKGICKPAVTPFTSNGDVDKNRFAQVLESLVAAGVHGIVVGGSTGEYYAQTADERYALAAFAKDVIGGRTALIIGTGATRTEDSVAYAKHAREIGADAILVSCRPTRSRPNARKPRTRSRSTVPPLPFARLAC